MSNPADPRRSAQVLMHHQKKIDDDLWRQFLKACNDPFWPEDRRWTEDEIQKWLTSLHREEFRGSAGFFYPHPWKEGQAKYQLPVQVSYLLRKTVRYQLSHGLWANVPRFETEGWNWASVTTNSSDLDFTNSADMTWFLGHVRCAVQFFEPDFACGALDNQLAKTFRKEEPREHAWPLAVYGSELVVKFGRDRLLAAPVFLAEELPSGGVWLQVLENPFVATKEDLTPLATHLELKVPKLRASTSA